MLAPVVTSIAEGGSTVSVFARNAEDFCRGKSDYRAYDTDWTDEDVFLSSVTEALAIPADLALAWCHTKWDGIPLKVAQAMSAVSTSEFELYLVLGSAFSNPEKSTLKKELRTRFEQIKNCKLRVIYLGFQIEKTGSRWLTNEEISAGVLAAMQRQLRETTIGVAQPWSAKP